MCSLARLVSALAIVWEPLFRGCVLDLSSINTSVVFTKLRSCSASSSGIESTSVPSRFCAQCRAVHRSTASGRLVAEDRMLLSSRQFLARRSFRTMVGSYGCSEAVPACCSVEGGLRPLWAAALARWLAAGAPWLEQRAQPCSCKRDATPRLQFDAPVLQLTQVLIFRAWRPDVRGFANLRCSDCALLCT